MDTKITDYGDYSVIEWFDNGNLCRMYLSVRLCADFNRNHFPLVKPIIF